MHSRYEFMTPEHREECEIRDRVGSGGTCCDRGERVHCVCRGSVNCPVHGLVCVGSHD